MKIVTLERRSVNKLNEVIAKRKIKKILAPFREQVSLHRKFNSIPSSTGYINSFLLKIKSDNETILSKIAQRAEKLQWVVNDGETDYSTLNTNDTNENLSSSMKVNKPFIVPSLTQETIETFFAGIYERDAHIRLIHDSVKNFVVTKGKMRSHILLYGPPAAAKTTLFERFKQFYENDLEEERILVIDSHTMTKAGLENLIIEKSSNGIMPEFWIFEELEKTANLDNLNVLLSIMQSGYLMKTNARNIGFRKRVETPIVIWATCNDEELLKRFRNGALWSRFTHKWRCTRPSKDVMRHILNEVVKKTDGDEKWTDIVIDLAYNKLDPAMDDPREIIGLLDGRERLYDGSYIKDLSKVLARTLKM